ncbi:MAG: hypothetical protein ACTSQN_18455, partial [Candidatus Heimdallarchaeota archaeon]
MDLTKIDLNSFLFAVKEQKYVIIKNDDFPNYYKDSNINIFCTDLENLVRLIMAAGNKYAEKGFQIKFCDHGSHSCVYFYLNEQLEFRFNLYNSFDVYTKFHIKPSFFMEILDNRVSERCRFKNKYYSVYVPCKDDELVIRYLEYVEHYKERPDQIKHLKYILREVNK